MGFSKSAVEQREQEVEALRSLLTFSLIGSLALHIGVLSSIRGNLSNRPKVEAEPVEVVVVDPPPIPNAQQSQVKTREEENSSGGSAALGGSITAKSQSSFAGGIGVARDPSRQSSPRSTPPSEPKATLKTLPKPLPIASPPQATEEKQPQPEVPASQQELIEDLKTAPAQKPKPAIETVRKLEPALMPTVVLPSPQSVASSTVPTSQPPVTVNQPSQSKPVAPTQPPPEFAKLKEQLARERSAANSTASLENPSGAGDRPARIAAGLGKRATSSTNTSSGSISVQGSGRNSGNGNSVGRNSGSGTASKPGRGSGQVATGTGSARQGTPRGRGSGEGDPEGSGSGRVACRSSCKPDYPGRARRQGQEGRVAVRVVADTNGKVTSAEIARSSGNSDLDQAALRQARRAKIEAPPGKPVTMNFSFSLKD